MNSKTPMWEHFIIKLSKDKKKTEPRNQQERSDASHMRDPQAEFSSETLDAGRL